MTTKDVPNGTASRCRDDWKFVAEAGSGGAGGRTKIRLWTRYQLATPFNAYAGWWGERILGDIQDNVLTIVAGRVAGRIAGEEP